MQEIRKAFDSKKISGNILLNESMSGHTSFNVGGPADFFVIPRTLDDLRSIFDIVESNMDVPLFILGAGANILVSDRGVRGIVADLRRFTFLSTKKREIAAGAGTGMSEVCEYASLLGLSGLEFIYGMPGSVGGGVWMNARCYGESICERLSYVDILTEVGSLERVTPDPADFSYKLSPFQKMRAVIVEVGFRLTPGNGIAIRKSMNEKLADRRRKGHFKAPSVGSVFKNNHLFGAPTGKIIDSVGLKGYQVGGARVADYHANIVINVDRATAADILAVIEHVEATVRDKMGFSLEREVLLVGDW